MSLPSLLVTLESPTTLDVDVLVMGISPGEKGLRLHAHNIEPKLAKEIIAAALSIDADGALEGLWRLPSPSGIEARSILLTGLGDDDPSAHALRNAVGSAVRACTKATSVAVSVPGGKAATAAIAEGALLGAHRAVRHGESDQKDITSVTIHGELGPKVVARVIAGAKAVWLVRDLVSQPPNMLTPEVFVSRVSELASELPLALEVLDAHQLREGGYGGLTAVGQGSQNPPRLLVLRYTPDNASRHVALVGKGITFDSGGLSLKPANSMVGMKYDMTGAAVVSAATLAAAELGGDTQVTAWVCLAENMPSGSASRPNDVITIKGGTTVEILNTDAEGRLVLADGLQAASAENPDLIIDVATLTGAARVALGERYAGLMGSEDAVAAVVDSAATVGELVWPMPLPEELRELLRSDVADIANAKPGNTLGGMLLAGLFLREFVGTNPEGDQIPWAHLDIAGPAANSSKAWGYTPKGPTGAITRTILEIVSGAPTKSK
jgi:leucyl aminopeptidase